MIFKLLSDKTLPLQMALTKKLQTKPPAQRLRLSTAKKRLAAIICPIGWTTCEADIMRVLDTQPLVNQNTSMNTPDRLSYDGHLRC